MFSVDPDSARRALESRTRPGLGNARIRTLTDVKQPSRARVVTASGEALSLTITSDLAPLAGDWRTLQAQAAVSPYQTFDLVDAWVRHAARDAGYETRIGAVRNAKGEVVMILPFGLVHRLGTTVAVYVGGSHFNVNLPLVGPSFRLEPDAIARMFDAYCRLTGADLLHLSNQPVAWRSVAHPFLCLPHQEAPDNISLIRVKHDDFAKHVATELTRKVRSELRRKAAKFTQAGARMLRADTPQDVDRFLDAFLAQKAKRLAAQGLDDPFASPGIKSFFRDAALKGLSGAEGVELHALEGADGHLLAVRGGARHEDQYALMVQSFDPDDPLAKYSPSEFLIAEVLADACRRGFTLFDFGVGANRFKKVWSNGAVELFNVTHAVSNKGRLYAGLVQLTAAAIRYIKRNPRLFSAVKDARALSARFRGSAE
jgi:CelD/BcsL family acetyltransferase involved in cellulose biosynthesis